MKVLFLTTRWPFPAIGGDRLRAFHILKHLLSLGHQVHLLSLNDSPAEEMPALPNLSAEYVIKEKWKCWRDSFTGLFRNIPLQVSYFSSGAFQKRVYHLLDHEGFDLAFCHLFRSAQFVLHRDDVRKLCDLTDAISLTYSRFKSGTAKGGFRKNLYRMEFPRVKSYERMIMDNFEETFVISKVDGDFLAEQNGKNPHILPNGVDLETFNPGIRTPSQIPSVIFVGNMTTIPNRDAVIYYLEEIHPRVLEASPTSTFHVIGANTPSSLIKRYSEVHSVRFFGKVANVAEAMKGAWVSVAPMRHGAGIQNKILESLAMGIPTITTPLGLEGIQAEPGVHLGVADNPEDFARLIASFLDPINHLEARALSLNGRRLMESKYTWENALNPLNHYLSPCR